MIFEHARANLKKKRTNIIQKTSFKKHHSKQKTKNKLEQFTNQKHLHHKNQKH